MTTPTAGILVLVMRPYLFLSLLAYIGIIRVEPFLFFTVSAVLVTVGATLGLVGCPAPALGLLGSIIGVLLGVWRIATTGNPSFVVAVPFWLLISFGWGILPAARGPDV